MTVRSRGLRAFAALALAALAGAGVAGCGGGGSGPVAAGSSGNEMTIVPRPPGRPDLAVASLAVSDAGPAPGAGFTLSATVRNEGDGDAPGTTLRFYRSADPTITTSDTEVGTSAAAPLAASGSSAESVTLTAPTVPGTYWYGACVKAVAEETDTADNCSASVQVTVTAPPATSTPPPAETAPGPAGDSPDLMVTRIAASAHSPASGTSFTLSVTVRNDGDGDAPSTTLRFYRSADPTITTSGTEVGTSAVAPLAASASSEHSISLTAPTVPGTYWYGACVKAVAEETDTADNCSASVQVTVTAPPATSTPPPATSTPPPATSTPPPAETAPAETAPAETAPAETAPGPAGDSPDLMVTRIAASAHSPASGTSFTLSVTVRNDGDGDAPSTTLRFYRSADPTITTSGTEVGTSAVAPLAASASSEHSISLTAPTVPGTYWYGACVKAVAEETDTADNCSASVQVTVRTPIPDLVTRRAIIDYGNLASGAKFTISMNVENHGDAATPATTMRFYLSTDETITASDAAVSRIIAVSPLPARVYGEGAVWGSAELTVPATSGTYWYGACVVPVPGEINTANNCRVAKEVTVPGPAGDSPDLMVTRIAASAHSPASGTSFTLSVTVRNDGDGDAPSTTLRFYRSADPTITTSGTEVGTSAVAPLAASASSEHSISLTAPTVPGTYWYGACVKAVAEETDTADNCSASVQVTVTAPPATSTPPPATSTPPPATSTPPPAETAPAETAPAETAPGPAGDSPDLMVTRIAASAHSPASGTSFTLSVTVRNDGDGDAPSTTLRFYRSADPTITTSGTEVGTSAVAPLAASASSEHSISLTAPTVPGTYWYGACVKAVAEETDTADNCSASVQVTVRTPIPDLVTRRAIIDYGNLASGAKFTISMNVENHGDAATPATTMRFYLSTDETITASDAAVSRIIAVSPLPARVYGEGAVWGSAELTVPATSGTYWYGACVVPVPGEINTANNCRVAKEVTVPGPAGDSPDLMVTRIAASAHSPASGTSFTLSVTVRNDGDGDAPSTTLRFYRSADPTITTSGTEVGTSAVAPLAASASSEHSISLTAPTVPGTYWYGACVKAVAEETDTADNCSASVQVTVRTPIPDLVTRRAIIDYGNLASGAKFTISMNVENHGDAATPATTMRFYLSTDETITASDAAVSRIIAVSPLPARVYGEGAVWGSAELTVPATSGTYWYGACVVPVPGEINTANNCRVLATAQKCAYSMKFRV